MKTDIIAVGCVIMHKEWRDVEGYEGLYLVSSLGRVKGCGRWSDVPDRLMKLQKHPLGYMFVGLSKGGKVKRFSGHRLVAKAFVSGETDYRNEVNHLNGLKGDNSSANLAWCSRKENQQHSVDNGLAPSGNTHPGAKSYVVVDPNGVMQLVTGITAFCKRNDLGYSNMIQVAKGNHASHKGWTCNYA